MPRRGTRVAGSVTCGYPVPGSGAVIVFTLPLNLQILRRNDCSQQERNRVRPRPGEGDGVEPWHCRQSSSAAFVWLRHGHLLQTYCGFPWTLRDRHRMVLASSSTSEIERGNSMVRIVSLGTTLLAVGGLAVSSLGFAGVAAAKPTCNGAIPAGSAHTAFANGSASSADCEDANDTGTFSMVKIAAAGSYSNGSSTITATPQKTT